MLIVGCSEDEDVAVTTVLVVTSRMFVGTTSASVLEVCELVDGSTGELDVDAATVLLLLENVTNLRVAGTGVLDDEDSLCCDVACVGASPGTSGCG